jgi:hypothetical protein
MGQLLDFGSPRRGLAAQRIHGFTSEFGKGWKIQSVVFLSPTTRYNDKKVRLPIF